MTAFSFAINDSLDDSSCLRDPLLEFFFLFHGCDFLKFLWITVLDTILGIKWSFDLNKKLKRENCP